MAKGDKKKKKKEVIELTPAERFVQLKTLKRATRCLLVDEDVYRIYVRLTKDFAQMDELGKETPFEGCEECAALSEECAALAKEWEKKLPAEKEVISRTVTTTVKKQEEDDNKKKGIVKWIVLAVIVAMIVCYNVPATRYQLAGLSAKVGFDKWASSTYEKLGDYKDCKNQIVLLEKKAIEKVKIGGVVKFGTCDWMVLERTDGKALLTKYMADNKHPYHDKSEKVTWESCALRKYLNGEFLEDGKFTPEELAMILTTNVENVANEEFGTDGGKNTQDKVFLMNEPEFTKYKKKLKAKAKTMRLRTPGKDATATTYVSALGDIITYGFPVDENGACIRPTMWVNLK